MIAKIFIVTFAICGAVSGTHLYGIIGESVRWFINSIFYFSSYNFDTFAPLHGFSYNPSAFHHGHGHWPFLKSNNYGHWKHHDGFGYNGPHHNYHHGIGHGFNFGSGIDGLSSFNKDKYEKIIEDIKKYKHQESVPDFIGLKSHGFSNFDNGDYKSGLGIF
ncbi:peptidoglycan-recognition protein SB2 [Nephila pilipes]|uniref:Peptidoglycan-recognition protein SB2 n=1 Tax=Nephila pilipes TaxID=299642 RepID=A0A8X6TMB5_NEPPI|nr:peptidoglycan-recognition protein SB2 [Nephila pilipes]